MADLAQQADDNELTTVQITKRTSRIIERLAKAYRRSKTAQVAYMADTEAAKLAQYKLLPELDQLPAIDEVA